MSHEIAHTIQQRESEGEELKTDGDPAAEHEADKSAAAAFLTSFRNSGASFRSLIAAARPRLSTGLRVSRCITKEPMPEEELVTELDSALERAEQFTEIGEDVFTDRPEALNTLRRSRESIQGLRQVTGPLAQAADLAEKARLARQTIDLVGRWDSINAYEDPAAAAEYFGKLFATVGEIGEGLPAGPWTPYFSFLKGAGGFFTNMRQKLDPELRMQTTEYRRKVWEEIEKH